MFGDFGKIFKLLAVIPALIHAVGDLLARINQIHSDPVITEAIQSDPVLQATSAAISQDARTIQNDVKNIGTALGHLGQIMGAVTDLGLKVAFFHTDPSIQAAISANPALKELSDSVSQDVRTLQESFHQVV